MANLNIPMRVGNLLAVGFKPFEEKP
jgi:hypothetical protein